jgi:hypothetical protein
VETVDDRGLGRIGGLDGPIEFEMKDAKDEMEQHGTSGRDGLRQIAAADQRRAELITT